ncbi:hypothetical protein Bbelb_022550 [Branchiostoma belcheri]|nr:hypothetical protein Bbelb_022550 [Branchiostoma belcheri]
MDKRMILESNTESSSVLLVCDQYATSKEDDVSTMNRQVVQILTGAGRKVYCLVLEDTEEDRKCAEADGVELILPTPIEGDTRKPCLDWLTFDHRIRYPRLPQDIGWIVGHADVTSRAATTIMEQRFPQASLSLVTQTIPEDTEKYKEEEKAMGIGKKEDSIRQDAEKADTVFSVGHRTHDHFTNTFRAIPEDKSPAHYLFLPEPSELFQKTTVQYRETKEKVVLLISRVSTVEKVKGFDLASKALLKVVERGQDRIKLRICGVSKEEYQASMDILQTSINSGKLIPTLLPHSTQEDICRDMQQAHLVLMPSRTEPFGLVVLEAMAAGVPVLISDQSGLATLVNEVVPEFHHSVLAITGNDSLDVTNWANQIEKVLRLSKAEFSRAAALKERLLESRYWEESHQSFLQACGGSGPDAQQPGQAETGERETDPTGETDESREAIKTEVPGPPPLPIVVEILAQVIPSIKTPEQLLSYASAKTTLATIDITKDEILLLLKQIMPEIKTIEDLVNTTEAVRQLSNIKGISVTGVKTGSLVFYLQCTDMSGLGQLWFMYKCGKLNDLLVGSLIREETLQQLCAESISVKTTINTEDFRKALIYLLTTSSAEGQPIPRLPQEYPLYQPHTHTTTSVLDVLHLDGTNLARLRSSGKQQELHIPPTTQTDLEDSLDGFETRLASVPNADVQHPTKSPDGTDMHKLMSELASLELEQQKGRLRLPRRSSSAGSSGHTPATSESGSSRPLTPTGLGGQDAQHSLKGLLAELNTSAVREDKAQQFDLYCQIGDLYRTKLHNLQSALQYYQNMLKCSQELSEDNKQAKAYSRLAYKNLASSLALSGQVSDAKINYESALAVAMETGNKTQQMDIYYKLGDLHREQLHEPQESLKYYTEMLALARDLGRKDWEGPAYNKLGHACSDMQDNEAALEWNQKSLEMSQESGDKTNQIAAHINMAGFYKALGKLDLARSHYQSAMTIAMETGNKTQQMDIYLQLGDSHREQLHEPQESHKYYTEMLALARDLGRKDRESQAYNRLGRAHYDMGEFEESLEWEKKGLKMRQESGDKTEQITAHKNIADSYKALGKLDLARSHYQSAMTITMETGNKTKQMDIYCKLGDLHREQLHEPQESHKYYTEMLALARDLGRKDREGDAYNRLGLVHYDMGEHEESMEWNNKYLKMRQESGDKTGQIIAHQCLAASYKALGKLDLARSHYQSAMTIAMETGNKTEQMNIYLQLGDLHREQLHEPQESLKYYTKMLALARDLGRKDREGDAYNRLGLAHYDMGGHKESFKWNKKYLKMRQETGDKTGQIIAHQCLAASYKALGKLDLARSHYQSAMTIAMETGNKTEQMDIYLQLGDLHREQLHEPQESLKYYTEMLALARDLGRKDREGDAYNRLGLAHYDMGGHKESLKWNKKYLKMRQETGDKTGQIIAHQCLAASYKALGKLDLARSHYQSAMTIAMETGNKQQQEDITKELANL